MLGSQKSSSSFVSMVIILDSYQQILFSILSYMFLLKTRTKSPIAKCIDESCFVISASCSKVFLLSYLISAKRLFLFFGRNGKCHFDSVNDLTLPLFFRFRVKIVFSKLVTNPAETAT